MRAHIDTEIEIKKSKSVGKESLHTAEVTKQRDFGGNGEKLYFKLKVVEVGVTKFGKTATSCIVVSTDETPEGLYPKSIKKDVQSLIGAYKFAEDMLTLEDKEVPFISKNSWVKYMQNKETNSKSGGKLSRESALQRLKSSVAKGKTNIAIRLIDAGIIAEFKDGFSILKKELVYQE
jgi:hypothetical protein